MPLWNINVWPHNHNKYLYCSCCNKSTATDLHDAVMDPRLISRVIMRAHFTVPLAKTLQKWLRSLAYLLLV